MDILTLTLSHSVPCKTYLFPHILYGKYCVLRDRDGGISAEELLHKVLYETSTHETLRRMKILVDVAWHWQPYEEYAETVAKKVGLIFDEKSRRLGFLKMRMKVLDSMRLPSFKDQANLVRDVVNEAQVDGKKCCKTDHRSAKGVKAYETIEKKSAEKSLPYR